MLFALQDHGGIFFEHCHLSGYTVFESPLKMLSKYFRYYIYYVHVLKQSRVGLLSGSRFILLK